MLRYEQTWHQFRLPWKNMGKALGWWVFGNPMTHYGIHWASSALGELWNAAVYLHENALKSWANIFGFIWWPNEMRHHDTWYNPAWGAWESNAMKWDVHMRILMGYDISSWQASAHGMRTNAYGFCSSHQLSAIKRENIAWEHCVRTLHENIAWEPMVLIMDQLIRC